MNILHIYIIYPAVSVCIYIYLYAHMFYEYHLLSCLLWDPEIWVSEKKDGTMMNDGEVGWLNMVDNLAMFHMAFF